MKSARTHVSSSCVVFLLVGPVEGTSGTCEEDVQIDDGTRASNVTWEGVAAGYIADNFGPGLMKRSWLPNRHYRVQLHRPQDALVSSLYRHHGWQQSGCRHEGPSRHHSCGACTGYDINLLAVLPPSVRCWCSSSRSLERQGRRCEFGLSPEGRLLSLVFMALTIRAGLTILVSGSRLLSAIEGDGTLPILRCLTVPPGREPRLALFASGVLCVLALLVGELNAVAPFQTMFFLMCYTCVNASCAPRSGERPQLAADVQALPLGHLCCRCRALRLDDVRHVADVRVGCGRVQFFHLCPHGPQILFGELRWLPRT